MENEFPKFFQDIDDEVLLIVTSVTMKGELVHF